MIALIGLIVFGAVFLATLALMRPPEHAVRRRIGANGNADDATPAEQGPRAGARVTQPFVRGVGRSLARVMPQHIVAGIDARLAHADDPWSLPGFLLTWLLSTLLGVAVVVYLAAAASMSGLQLIVLGAAIIAFAAVIPYAVLRRRANARRKAIVRALPDAIDLLLTSVEAGLGVDASFALVVDKTEGPLAEAFALYLRQVGLGRDRRAALTEIAERTGVRDLQGVANAINQGEELGTTLGDVLRVQAEDLRRLRRQRAEMAAQRAPVMMTIPLTLCFLPAMGAVIIVPSVLNLLDFVGTLGK
jgi:tight adherence protein C